MKPDELQRLTDLGITPELRQSIEHLRLRVADQEQMAKLALRLEGLLGSEHPPSTREGTSGNVERSAPAGGAAAQGTLGALKIGLLLSVGAGLLAWVFGSSPAHHAGMSEPMARASAAPVVSLEEPQRSPLSPAIQRSSQRALVEGPAPPGDSPREVAPAATASAELVVDHPRHADPAPSEPQMPSTPLESTHPGSRAVPPAAPSTKSAATKEWSSAAHPKLSELELLQLARSRLTKSPAESLVLAEQHRSQFASSAFAQEREMIAVTALVRLGRVAEGRIRAEQFRRTYPSSAYLRQLEKLFASP